MLSPSMRREWIEMTHLFPLPGALLSPSMRREWIEMCYNNNKEGGDESLPPCGGSGLKCFQPGTILDMQWSPSMRREWIEIFLGSGLFPNLWSPSMRREWIEMKMILTA